MHTDCFADTEFRVKQGARKKRNNHGCIQTASQTQMHTESRVDDARDIVVPVVLSYLRSSVLINKE